MDRPHGNTRPAVSKTVVKQSLRLLWRAGEASLSVAEKRKESAAWRENCQDPADKELHNCKIWLKVRLAGK